MRRNRCRDICGCSPVDHNLYTSRPEQIRTLQRTAHDNTTAPYVRLQSTKRLGNPVGYEHVLRGQKVDTGKTCNPTNDPNLAEIFCWLASEMRRMAATFFFLSFW